MHFLHSLMTRVRTLRIKSQRFGATAATCLLCLLYLPPAQAASITVYAAASMKESLGELARQYEAQSGDKVVVSYAASSALAKQIENGAPADLFISADIDWMDYLAQRTLIVAASRVNLLSNRLVLIAPAGAASVLKIAPGFALAARLGSDKLAMANPDHVPAGKYGKAALRHLGVWSSVEKQVARADNVRAALTLVSRAEAPYGIVYRTDALADKNVVIVDTFPADSHPPIVYPAALIATTDGDKAANSGAAKNLLDYLRSDTARASWQKYGFGIPSK